MTDRAKIEDTIRSLYKARIEGDLDRMMKSIADDAVLTFHGRGTGQQALSQAARGKDEIRPMLDGLVKSFRFDDWTEKSLLVDCDKALLHWTARVICTQTGKAENFDVFDLVCFHDGKIVEHHQCTDTALLMKIAG